MTEWAMVILTVVYVIATILICYFNYRSANTSKEQAEEMKRQYDAENRPYITAELIYERRNFYGLRFANHGKRIANHVSIKFENDFIDSLTEPAFKSLLKRENDRKCIIGIGQHHDLYFGTNQFRDKHDKLPLCVHITYSNGEKVYTEDIHIDFDTYATFFSIDSYTDDLLKEIKTQGKELKRIREVLMQVVSESNIKKEIEDK